MLRTMRDRLAAEAFRFDFYQAVRLLEMIESKAISPAAGSDPCAEPVRFRSRVALEFPASDVHEIRFPEGRRPEMLVNFMSLAGALGPLPLPLTEMILASPRGPLIEDETGMPRREPPPAIDFLDIFNHRLISLMYRVRQTHRPALTSRRPEDGQIAHCLFALIGLGQPGLRGRLAVEDRSLLRYSGILARRPRSASGLRRMLSDYFGVPVHVRHFVGRWQRLDRSQWTVLGGPRGRNARLGVNTIAGTRVWDEQSLIEVGLGPLPREKFLALLPEERLLATLRARLQEFLALPIWVAKQAALRDSLTEVQAMLLDSAAHEELSGLLREYLAKLAAAKGAEVRGLAQDFQSRLPRQGAHRALIDLVRFYLAPEIGFRVALVAEKGAIPATGLGAAHLRLGFTSVLASPPELAADLQLGSNAWLAPVPANVAIRMDTEY
jgi:type VI secretion system protein ImpH